MLTIQNIHSLYKKDIVGYWRVANVLTKPDFYHIELSSPHGNRKHIAVERNVRPDGFYTVIYNDVSVLYTLSAFKTMDSFIEVLKRLIK